MRVDVLSLASGAVTAALGVLVLLDSSSAFDISLGWSAVILSGAVGAIMVLSGFVAKTPERAEDTDRQDQ
jgi:hypothetical protein